MAYVERWWTSFQNLGQSVTYAIRIKENNYAGGTTPIEQFPKEPLRVRNRGNKEFSIGSVIGTEIEFSFWITPSDGALYDDLFTSVRKQFLIEVEKDGALYFAGFMKTENMNKPVIDYRYTVKLSATDGLAELKNISFRTPTGDNYTDRVSILTNIKRALDFTGHQLDIKVKLGTYESATVPLMTSVECALDKCSMSSQRFYKTEDGILKPVNCNQVLTDLIGVFNCSIMQLNGEWYIYNNVEVNSFLFTFDWATLTQQSRIAHNNSIAIDLYNFKSVGQLSYRPPLSEINITFENKYITLNLITNGDFSSGVTGWANGTGVNAWDGFGVAVGELEVSIIANLDDDKTFISNTFPVVQVSTSDKIVLEVRTITDSSFPYPALIHAVVTNTTGGSVKIPLGYISNGWQIHKPAVNPEIIGSGDYTVEIVIEADSVISSLAMRIDDISLYVDYGASDVTTDKIYTITNDDAIDELKESATVRIGDSLYTNDLGAMQVGINLTSMWSTFGNTESKKLIELLGAFQLNQRQNYVKYIRLEISDPDDNINSGSIIIYDTVQYRIVRYNKIFNNMTVSVDLLELNT